MKGLAGGDAAVIQVGGAEDEGAGRVGESAGAGGFGAGFEDAGVEAISVVRALSGGLAVRGAGEVL